MSLPTGTRKESGQSRNRNPWPKRSRLAWKRYIDDIFSLWGTIREVLTQFIDQANNHHPSIKFTAEISDAETTFLDTSVYTTRGERFMYESVLDIRTHYKPTETCQYTQFFSCHPPGVKKGFIKGEALRLLKTNFLKQQLRKKIKHFQSHLVERGYPGLVQRTLLEVIFENRKQALQPKPKTNKKILPFVTEYHPAVPNLKQILMKHYCSKKYSKNLLYYHPGGGGVPPYIS